MLLTKSGRVFTMGRRVCGVLGRGDVDVDADGGIAEPGQVVEGLDGTAMKGTLGLW